jgi:hypothetical protein
MTAWLIKRFSFFSPASAKQLRAKVGRTIVACVEQGHRKFCRSGGNERTQWGKKFQPVVLSGLRGKGSVRKEVFLPTWFFVTLYQDIRRSPLEYIKKTNNYEKLTAHPRGE